jgi:CheY-like chemotaxis protein
MPANTIAWIEAETDEIAPVVEPLRRAGFTIHPFAHYAEAVARMDEIARCDLILLDLILPPGPAGPGPDAEELLGRRLLRRIRHEFGLGAPAIVLSVVANTDAVEEAEAEVLRVSLLAKPARPSRLKAEVYRLLNLEEA